MNKEELENLIIYYTKDIEFINSELVEKAVKYFSKKNISNIETENELKNMHDRILECEKIVKSDIPYPVLNKSIIFIGPMCAGKSTISEFLSDKIKMPMISLDDREQLLDYYRRIEGIRDFKLRELALVGLVLTELKQPAIINFGAGHSIQDDTISRIELERLMSRFKNIILIQPCRDHEESKSVLRERIKLRKLSNSNYNIEQNIRDNEHFIDCGYNERIANITIETEGKTVEQCAQSIIRIMGFESISEK